MDRQCARDANDLPGGGPVSGIVLQASGPNALGIVRSLGRVGVPVVAVDVDAHALGLRSKYATPRASVDPLLHPSGFVDDVEAIGRTLASTGVLYATHDEALSAIGPSEERLRRVVHVPWSPWPVMSRVLDKAHQHAVARSIGFPIPETIDPTSDADIEAAIRALRFPMILKPRNAPEFRRKFRTQVFEANTPDELRRAWEDAAAYDPQLSEVIPGGDDALWTLGSYRNREGQPLASFTGRKLRQWPPRFGTARAAESRWDPDLAARCHLLLDALEFHGISQVEVKRDPRDGRDYLIEVNPRSWLWIGLATAVGVNLPQAAYLDAIGRPVVRPDGHRDGVRWTLLAKHLVAGAREVRRGEWSARALAQTLRPPIMDGVLDLRDPRPALSQYRRMLRRG